MSQDDLAKSLGVSRTQMFKYESGDNRLSAGRFYELSHLLQVPITWFFDGFDGSSANPSSRIPLSDADIAESLEQAINGIHSSLLNKIPFGVVFPSSRPHLQE